MAIPQDAAPPSELAADEGPSSQVACMTSPPLGLTEWTVGSSVVVSVTGEVDIATTAQLSDALGAALRRGAMGLVCDLSGVSFFGAAGVTTLLMGRQRAIACHAWFDLVCPQPFPRMVIALVGLDAVFNVYDRLAEAVNAQARHVDRPGLTTTPQTSDILPSCSPGVGSGDSKQQ